jgi:hypothetical protein
MNTEGDAARLLASLGKERDLAFEQMLIAIARGVDYLARGAAESLWQIGQQIQQIIYVMVHIRHPPLQLVVRRHGNGYRVSPADNSSMWDDGLTKDAALGNWLRTHSQELNIGIVDL